MLITEKRKRRLRNSLLLVLGIYVMIGTLLYTFQEKLLFMPTTLEQDFQYAFTTPYEELFFETEDHAIINAIHFKTKNPKGVILYFHGNAGDLSRWGIITEYFVQYQYDVLVMDYRGYGKSTGKRSEEAFYKDAQYCYDHLLKAYPEDSITIYGRSLGTGIASYLASKNKPQQLILETPYYSIADVAKKRFPIFPVKQLLKYKFPTYKYLAKVNCPITVFHGTDDLIVPYSSGKKLTKLGLKSMNFKTIEGGKHNNLVEFEAFDKAIAEILK